ncbi:MAG: hypothetical protein K1Y36_18660 [Blastocatellia bacterium]|nr:hypothetical protein [Blastocatellia bacterium]
MTQFYHPSRATDAKPSTRNRNEPPPEPPDEFETYPEPPVQSHRPPAPAKPTGPPAGSAAPAAAATQPEKEMETVAGAAPPVPPAAGEKDTVEPPKAKKSGRLKAFLLCFGATGGMLLVVVGYLWWTTRGTVLTVKKQPVAPTPAQTNQGSALGVTLEQIRQSNQTALAQPAPGSTTNPPPGQKPPNQLDRFLNGGAAQTIPPAQLPPGPAAGPAPIGTQPGFQPFPTPPAVNPVVQPVSFQTGTRDGMAALEASVRKNSFVFVVPTGNQTSGAAPAVAATEDMGAVPATVPAGTEIKAMVNQKVFNFVNSLVVATVLESIPGVPAIVPGSKLLGYVKPESQANPEKRIYVQFYLLVLPNGTQLRFQGEAWDKGQGLQAKEYREWRSQFVQMGKDTLRDSARDVMSLIPVVGSRLGNSFGQGYNQFGGSGQFGSFGGYQNQKALFFKGGGIVVLVAPPPADSRTARLGPVPSPQDFWVPQAPAAPVQPFGQQPFGQPNPYGQPQVPQPPYGQPYQTPYQQPVNPPLIQTGAPGAWQPATPGFPTQPPANLQPGQR